MSVENWQKAQSEVDGLGSPVYHPTVLSDQDFNQYLRALNSCSHDDGRESVIEAMVNGDSNRVFIANQVGAIMRTYSFDSGRCDALELLGPRVADPPGLLKYNHTMSHDDGRKSLSKWSAGTAIPIPTPAKAIELRGTKIFLKGAAIGLAVGGILGGVLGALIF